MARPLRVEYEGAIYHVMARGNLRQAIFRSPKDRLRFLDKLEETAERHGLRVYAWALMTTHYHILLCTPRGNLSRAMHQLQSSYSTYVRVRHSLSGHVFGGRYKARLVEGDQYLLALIRYIHLNPLHTDAITALSFEEKVDYLRRYAWSSHRDYGGYRRRFNWLLREPLLNLVAEGRSDREAAYRTFVISNIDRQDVELEKAMALSSKAIGSSAFCAWAEDAHREVLSKQGSPEDAAMRKLEAVVSPELVERTVAQQAKTTVSNLLHGRGNNNNRDVLLIAWRDLSGLSNREIGHRLGHADGATVGKRFKQLQHQPQYYAEIYSAVVRIKNGSIANCKA